MTGPINTERHAASDNVNLCMITIRFTYKMYCYCIGASALNELLKVNNSLQELDMSINYIGDEGISSIAEGLQSNKSLTNLKMEYCKFSSKGR